MSIIQFKEANCKNCHKCIRNCFVKSIQFENEQARIIEDECILCGHCFKACPQNAKYIQSDLDEIKAYIQNDQKVYVSLAPSYVSAFPGVSFSMLSKALKKLGFTRIEETAIGAAQISSEYVKLLKQGQMKNLITTCCPTTVLLVERYYPELVPYLAPVISPAMAHAKMMKNIYGPKIKVVFIGPCISKKYEANQNAFINSVLLFDDLLEWMKEEAIDLSEIDEEPSEMHNVIHRLYPVPGGIIRTIPKQSRNGYKSVAIDGLDRCIEILDSIRDHDIQNYFIEMSACAGSCIAGPGLKDMKEPFLRVKDQIVRHAGKKTVSPIPHTENTTVDFSAQYKNLSILNRLPDEETIREILLQIDKTSPETMFNCGACGYASCRDKAIAVYQGKADLKMCIPFMREKAESMSNLILENTPNAIFVLNSEFNIIEYNTAAIRIFQMTEMNYLELPVQMLLGEEVIDRVSGNSGKKDALMDYRTVLMDIGKTVEVSIMPIKDTGNYLVIVKDVTKEDKQFKEIAKIRTETLETAQKVIDKQMRVAQEIASLLGETTGETKAALTKLKKSMLEGELK